MNFPGTVGRFRNDGVNGSSPLGGTTLRLDRRSAAGEVWGMTTLLENIRRGLAEAGTYVPRLDDGSLRISDPDLDSEYSLEVFEQSVQIRQGVWFECQDLAEEELSRIYALCSMMNQRFSGCKCCVDQWGTLITVADILGPGIAIEFIETMLNQVEFMSQALQELVETMNVEGRLVTEAELDAALEVPPLH